MKALVTRVSWTGVPHSECWKGISEMEMPEMEMLEMEMSTSVVRLPRGTTT